MTSDSQDNKEAKVVQAYDIILFTTMAAQRPLYRRDALNALSYPDGWQLSLSYRGKWVHPDLWSAGAANRLKGKRVLFVLCCAPDHEFREFVPLRLASIAKTSAPEIQTEDAVLTLWLEVRHRPSVTTVQGLSGKLRSSNPGHDGPYYPAKDRPYYALFTRQFSSGVGANEGGDEIDWHDHVDRLVTAAPEIKDCQFARLSAIRRINVGGKRKVVNAHTAPVPDSALTQINLHGGRAYEFEFHVHERSMTDRAEPPVYFPNIGAHVEITTPLMTQHGSDALIVYPLIVQRKYAPENLSLLARTRSAGDRPALLGDGPEFQALLRILPPRWYSLFLFGGVTLSALFVAADRDALTAVGFCAPYWPPVAKGLGALCLGLTSWYAVRKLPLKL
jgi:hypothetical protein